MGVLTLKPNSGDPTIDIEGGSIKLSASGDDVGTAVTQIRAYLATSINPASVAANITVEQTFAVVGLTTADRVFLNHPLFIAGLGVAGCRVSAADTLAITFVNATAGALDAGATLVDIIAFRF